MPPLLHPVHCKKWIIIGITVLILAGLGGLSAFASSNSYAAARGADVLRSLFGDKFVADLEMIVFQAEDSLLKWKYDLGLEKPAAPWQGEAAPPPGDELAAAPVQTTSPPIETTPTPYPVIQVGQTTPTLAPVDLIPSTEPPEPSPQPSPTPAAWRPAPASPLGALEGEGSWSSYIQNAAGETVAWRTYLQPDPQRPYALVGVVAFDLSKTHLGFVLGSEEPWGGAADPRRTGKIPSEDFLPGKLLATFCGGFKAEHGQFGAMAGGITALPPRSGLGTVAIFADGRVAIGEWDAEMAASPEIIALRQNGPLVIQAGQINPRIYNNDPKDWGYTLIDVSPTWRSGLGISPGGDALYFFAGSSLSMEALANSMIAAGAAQGIQLDINKYWVLFTAIRPDGTKLIPEPLFPETMNENINRYLYAYTRDYFYIAAR